MRWYINGVTEPRKKYVAIWAQPVVCSAIVDIRTQAHLDDMEWASELDLDEETLERLNESISNSAARNHPYGFSAHRRHSRKKFTQGDPPEKYSDPDDVQSLIRFLLCINDLEIEAPVASAGTLSDIAQKRDILDVLDVYEQVQPNLIRHDPRYPTADTLRSVTWQGLDGTWGSPHFESREGR